MLKRSVVAVGAVSDVDLTECYLKNHSEITSFLKEKGKGEDKNGINTIKYFLNLKPGDFVAVKSDGSPKGKKSFLSIIGIAEVCEKGGKIYELKFPAFSPWPSGRGEIDIHNKNSLLRKILNFITY